MKKLKLDITDIQVLSFTVETEKGAGTVNAHLTEPAITTEFQEVYGGTTLKNTDCNSCPFCVDEPIGPAGP
ncbi:hypothetical protein [Longimicrobium sp.]|uniref:hypothetical protein n=1 Tax=Longimicrobium sp. TaxID=2029185 RepID=UPI002E33277E|nr:hypothetical protein [Longimicrobium sp.]HEX6041660.1 hypothetical protein [Longimicrobium sp.]